MTPYIIDRNSWHYKLARFTNSDYDVQYCEDICSYRSKVFWSLFWSIVVSLIIFVFVYCVVKTWAVLVVMMVSVGFHLAWETFGQLVGGQGEATIIVGMLCTAVPTALAILLGTVAFIQHFSDSHDVTPVPGFVKTTYSSWKDKYCVPIEFK